jgi:HD superfamily phosphohydrolase
VEFVKQIRDPVHGWIRLTKEESEFVDNSLVVQRLRYVRQLGMAYLVYPTAAYSRFDHSLGVMHLAYLIGRELLSKRGVSAEEAEKLLKHLRMAALLHDVGHFPFSHTFEAVVRDLVAAAVKDWRCVDVDVSMFDRARPHEVTTQLILERISPQLREHGYDPQLVKALLTKKYQEELPEEVRVLSSIISGTLDADRLDYIMRDIHFTGAAVGTAIGYADIERIINSMSYVGDLGIIFDEKARVHLEGYIITRYQLYRHVYLHHKTVLFTEIARKILWQAVLECRSSPRGEVCEYLCDLAKFAAGDVSEEVLWKATDDYFTSVFTKLAPFRDLMARRRLGYISLWKRDKDYLEVFGEEVKSINKIIDEVYSSSEVEAKQILKQVLVEELKRVLGRLQCDLDEDDIELAYAYFDPKADDVYISTREGPIQLERLSPLVQAVKEAWERSPHFFVYVKDGLVKRCGERALAYLRRALPAVLPYVAKISRIDGDS